jgi:hypothetical protein
MNTEQNQPETTRTVSRLDAVLDAWMPVKDHFPEPGKMVLACYKNSAGEWRIICGYWTPENFMESGPNSEIGEYDEARDKYYDPPGWYERIDNCDEYSHFAVCEGEVSHWMPMPSTPSV